jgi:NADPH:quinone reductase-like Zn-dependent oxidoreductase
MEIDQRLLIVGQKRIEGFWLSEWAREQGIVAMLKLFRRIGRLLQGGVLSSDIGKTFGLDQVAEAARLAEQPGRQGKVLLRIAPHGTGS